MFTINSSPYQRTPEVNAHVVVDIQMEFIDSTTTADSKYIIWVVRYGSPGRAHANNSN